ncbi:MAG: N-acetylglucosamine-6-phosphate deacetylase [Desulfocucumaceae bacterium]
MNNYLICRGQLVTSSGTVPNTGLLVTRGKIAAPGAMNPNSNSSYAGLSCCSIGACPVERIEIDAGDLFIAPGFIDLHVHGGNGYDTLDGSTASLNKTAQYHAGGGTTSFLATVAPAPDGKLKKILSLINALTLRITEGAQLLGAHMEGPYLNPARAGAINPAHLKHVDTEEMEYLVALCEGSLKMVTVAPELPGCTDLIKMLSREGVIVAAGHSEADFQVSEASFRAGVKHAVHLFNASAPLNHREPGLVGAVLANRDINAEIIADGHHLHPSMLKLLYSIKGSRGLTLATDAVSATGRPDGDYVFNGRKVTLKGGIITLPDGTLAGSTLTMIEAVRNMVNLAQIPLHEAVRMASLNPARLLGRESAKGALAPGMDADLVLMDRDLNVVLTMVGGKIVYTKNEAPFTEGQAGGLA